MCKLPQELDMQDGRYVTISKDMHAKMLTVAEIAKSMVMMCAVYHDATSLVSRFDVKNLYIPEQTNSGEEINVTRDIDDVSLNTVVIYTYDMPVFITQGYWNIVNLFGERLKSAIMLIIYNKVGEYKVVMVHEHTGFAKHFNQRVHIASRSEE